MFCTILKNGAACLPTIWFIVGCHLRSRGILWRQSAGGTLSIRVPPASEGVKCCLSLVKGNFSGWFFIPCKCSIVGTSLPEICESHAPEITSRMPCSSSSSSSSVWDPYLGSHTVFPQMVGLIDVVWLFD
jgi:hypothetical protein